MRRAWLLALLLLWGCGSPGPYLVADGFGHRLLYGPSLDGPMVPLGSEGSGRLQFREPSDVDRDAEGRIYVVDRRNRRVVRMDDLSGAGWTEVGGDLFEDPLRLAVHPVTGDVFVTDFARSRVVRLPASLEASQATFLEDGWTVLLKPADVAFDGYGRLYIANDESCRLIRITDPYRPDSLPWEVYDGAEIPGDFPGTRGMGGVTVAPDGHVFLVVMAGDQVVRLDPSLANPVVFGRRGTGPGELYNPRSLVVDAAGRLLIVDSGNNRIVRVDDISGAGWTVFSPGVKWPWAVSVPGAPPVVAAGKPPQPVEVPRRISLYRPEPSRSSMQMGESLDEDMERPVQAQSGARAPAPPPGLPRGAWLVVSDTYNHRLVFLGRAGRRAVFRTFGRHGRGVGEFSEPRGLAVDAEGRLLVVDSDNHRIVRISGLQGEGWAALEGGADYDLVEQGPRDRTFDLVDGIAVHPRDGRIFFSDTNNNRLVSITGLDGAGWTEYGDGGRRFRNPCGLEFDPQGRLFTVTTDVDYQIVRIDDLADTSARTWKFYDGADITPLPRFRDAYDVAVGPDGLVWATDPTNDRVVSVTADLTDPRPYGSYGLQPGHLRNPLGLDVFPDGRVAVVDAGSHRVAVFDPRRSSPVSLEGWWSVGTDGAGMWQFASPSYVRLWVPAPRR